MSAPITQPSRAPIIGGIAGGCGTSLVASLLGVGDIGTVSPGQPVDVLVCRSVSSHLTTVTALANQAPVPPIVVINADAPIPPPRVVKDRARMLEPRTPGVLWLPFIEPLRAMSDPLAGAREEILAEPLPRAFRKAFAFRQALVDTVIELLTKPAAAPIAPETAAGYALFRQTS